MLGSPFGLGVMWHRDWESRSAPTSPQMHHLQDAMGSANILALTTPCLGNLFAPSPSVLPASYLLSRLVAQQIAVAARSHAGSSPPSTTQQRSNSHVAKPIMVTGGHSSGKSVLVRATLAVLQVLSSVHDLASAESGEAAPQPPASANAERGGVLMSHLVGALSVSSGELCVDISAPTNHNPAAAADAECQVSARWGSEHTLPGFAR